MWNLVPLYPPEDVFIHEILTRDRGVSSSRVRQHGSDGLRQPAGLRSLILTRQQLAMCRFNPILIHLWLSLLLLRQRTGNERQAHKDREHENRLHGFHPKVLLMV